MKTLTDLAEMWEDEAATLERRGAKPNAVLLRACADELRTAITHAEMEMLTLAQAVEESGFSERRIRELIAEGTIPNAGRKGAPRVRRCDLPRKPKPNRETAYDAAADARNLLSVEGRRA